LAEGVVRRIGNLFEEVSDFANLRPAFTKASRGKRTRGEVTRFFRDLEPELLLLQRELVEGSYRPGPFEVFTIRDPKERLISCPPFRDRVVHHAVINILEPILEARFDADSYGCRKGRGMDAALLRAQEHARRWPFVLKTDVLKFYDSIDLAVLRGQIRRIVKDPRLLALLDIILGDGEKGLPIGSLTSQWLANLYLTPLDRHLRSLPVARGQVRYMDDVLVFGAGREDLREVRREMRRFLADELRLKLHAGMCRTARSLDGIPFLGFRVLPGTIEVRRESFRRFAAGVRRAEWQYRVGQITADTLAGSVSSRIAHLERGRSLGLRCGFFATRRTMEW
jgi:RNA-directed DNA polymerase